MKQETSNWLDYCKKFNDSVDTLNDYLLMEYGAYKDNEKRDLAERCQIKFEMFTHPVYLEFMERLETHIQILRVTGHLKGDEIHD